MEEYLLPDDQYVGFERRRFTTSRLWYAALVPLFGIFIEIYANSMPLGLLVWITALISAPAACLLDRRYIKKMGADTSSLKTAYTILPPLYIFKRTKLTGDSRVSGIVWCMMLVYALIMNGFTRNLTMNEISITQYISETYWSRIEETAEIYCDKSVNETLEELSGGSLTWSGSRAKDCLKVECTGENGFSADFTIDYDGYIAGNRHLDKLTFEGNTLDGAAAAELIEEKFGKKDDESEAPTESVPAEEGSSDDDSAAAEDESAAA